MKVGKFAAIVVLFLFACVSKQSIQDAKHATKYKDVDFDQMPDSTCFVEAVSDNECVDCIDTFCCEEAFACKEDSNCNCLQTCDALDCDDKCGSPRSVTTHVVTPCVKENCEKLCYGFKPHSAMNTWVIPDAGAQD